MVKYIIREIIPFEGYNQWSVFAQSPELALHLVKADSKYTGAELRIHSTRPAKGRKKAAIHKYTYITTL